MTIEKATTPGILDSTVASEGKPFSSKLAREMVRTGNFLAEADANMLIDSWAISDEVTSTVTLAQDWLMVYTWVVPARPVHRRANTRIRLRGTDGAGATLRLQTSNNTRVDETVDLLGSTLVSVDMELPLISRDRHIVELWARSRGEVDPGLKIGLTSSWTNSTNTTNFVSTNTVVIDITFVNDELATGYYTLELVENSIIVLSVRILGIQTDSSGNEVLTIVRLSNGQFQHIRNNINNYTFRVREIPAIALRSINMRGSV